MKPTFAPVFTSPLRRPFRASGLAGFSAVAEQGAVDYESEPSRPGEGSVEGRHMDKAANGSVFGTKGSAIT